MVPARVGDDAALDRRERRRGEGVVGAAELERAGALQALRLDVDVAVERQPQERRAHRDAVEPLRGRLDVGERDGKRACRSRQRSYPATDTLPRVSTEPDPVELHIVSDSTGETAARLVLALEAQFPEQVFAEIRHPRVESVDDLQLAVATARGRPAVMVYTLVEPGLREAMRQLCRRARVHYCDLLGHPIDSIARVSGVAARMTPGARPPLDQTYFKRIEAIEFAVKYDDGVGSGLDEADVVLVGVSRTSKTPLSIYLGYLGHKAANVPIVKGIEPPPTLFEIDPAKVVGLTIEAERLSEIRLEPGRDDGRAEEALRGPARRLRGARPGDGDPPAARLPGARRLRLLRRGDRDARDQARRRPPARAARPARRERRSLWRSEGRSIDEKGWVPLRYWLLWSVGLGAGGRAVLRDPDAGLDRPPRAAWLAEFRARRRR